MFVVAQFCCCTSDMRCIACHGYCHGLYTSSATLKAAAKT